MKKFLLMIIGTFVAAALALADTAPILLPFQGRLTDQNGIAISNGVKVVQFKIYNVPAGGSPVWAGEVHRTTVNGGLVNVMLGTKTPLNGVDFSQQLYLEITVDVSGPGGIPDNAITEADPPMLPRQVILPVVFASESANSRALAGYDWTSIFGTNSPVGGIPGAKIQGQSITSAEIAPQSLTAAVIAPQTITSNQIGIGAISGENLANAIIQAVHLSPGLIQDAIVPPGTVIAWMGTGTNPPPGWQFCWGQTVARGDLNYARLFGAIGTSSGTGDGSTTFILPDLRGMFLRGVNGSQNNTNYWDPDVSARTNLYTGGNTGNNVGSVQTDQFRSHVHGNVRTVGGNIGSGNDSGFVGASTTTSATGGHETRPVNVYVQYLIKL